MVLISLTDHQPAFCTEFSAELETTINTVLCVVQTLVKRREGQQQSKQHGDIKRGENDAFEDRSGVQQGKQFKMLAHPNLEYYRRQ